MNMTQEEVTKRLKALKARCERLIVSSSAGNPEEWRKDAEAIDMALTALRPVSREQVRKAWKGEWTQGGYACGEHEWECSKCHETEWRTSCSRLKFCPFCGAPMTDEAVEMVMERLDELHD